MFNNIKTLFSKSDPSHTLEFEDEEIVPIAAAMVLLEVAWADHILQPEEIDLIESALIQLYGFDQIQAERVLKQAESEHKQSTGLHKFTRTLNEQLDIEEKVTLLTHLWRMNNLESASFHYEEHMIRKIADLLHLRHSEFIRAKLAAKQYQQP
ncbi:MAG: TerB family tellurite resistance protein [Gammaproteobacteria bacterium]|nr:TerB family tellurite resistance protein [Gammaproteobacteria bacterium]MYF37214.1 TerB family tellurite resistance protein [Gammaproteobacteria bacterium]